MGEIFGRTFYCFDRMVEAFHDALKIFIRLLVASLKETTLGANIDKLIM